MSDNCENCEKTLVLQEMEALQMRPAQGSSSDTALREQELRLLREQSPGIWVIP